MRDTLRGSELFSALFADVAKALKPHMSAMVCRVTGQQAWVEGRTIDGRSLSVAIVIDDSMLRESDDSGPWWDWTPTP